MELTAKQKWTKEARQFFRQVLDNFEVDEQHIAVFYGTVENLDRFYVAANIVEVEGVIFKSKTGQIRKNPACAVQKDAWSAFLMGLKALGLHEYQAKLGRPPGG